MHAKTRVVFLCPACGVCRSVLCLRFFAKRKRALGQRPAGGNEAGPQPLCMLHSSDEKAGKKAKTNDGIYFVEWRDDDSNGSNLLYLDYATRQAIVVCEKPDCLHN